MLAVSTNDPAPLVIRASQAEWDGSSTGKIAVPLQILRRGEVNNAFKLKPAGTAAFNALKEIDVDAKATNATVELDIA